MHFQVMCGHAIGMALSLERENMWMLPSHIDTPTDLMTTFTRCKDTDVFRLFAARAAP